MLDLVSLILYSSRKISVSTFSLGYSILDIDIKPRVLLTETSSQNTKFLGKYPRSEAQQVSNQPLFKLDPHTPKQFKFGAPLLHTILCKSKSWQTSRCWWEAFMCYDIFPFYPPSLYRPSELA